MKRDLIEQDNANKIIRLDRNECICPSVIRDIIQEADLNPIDYCGYTSAYNFINVLSDNLQVNSNNIYVDNGSECILKNLISILPCSDWVIPNPTFELFPVYCKLFEKKIHNISFLYKNYKFSVDIPKIKGYGLYLVDPHNPTGISYSDEEITLYCSYYQYVILDQAYLDPLTNILKFPPNLIVVRTFSKLGGLTGMRLGYCYSYNTDIIQMLNTFRPMFINSVSLKLAIIIILGGYTQRILNEFKCVKNILKNYFTDDYVLECGNFILLKNISNYKGYNLKQYIISNEKFYRMTIFDMETFHQL
jgi:histidinol-phosphate/aromatic aminotransferase/cobyric acid decarboxylase-like protein